MPRTHHITLSPEQEAELIVLRDNSPKPHLRERAAAILKVAAGATIKHVAEHGLLRPRDEGTVADWIGRYETRGTAGLGVRPGRGRKPAFFPSAPHRRAGQGRDPGVRSPLASTL